jgi:hypothetical protein
MTLKKVLYRTRVHITGSWKKALMMHPLLRVVFISLLAAQATPNTAWAQVKAVPPLAGVIGKVQSVTDGFIILKAVAIGIWCVDRVPGATRPRARGAR